jgi:uncharacterized coiled-coil protein SlyX
MSHEPAATTTTAATGAGPGVEGPPYVQLFQKAHQHIVLLDRIDEQLAQLWSKRTDLQEELRTLQQQINDELEDRISAVGEPPAGILGNVAAAGAASVGGAPHPPLAQRAGAGANANRFANQSLTTLAGE